MKKEQPIENITNIRLQQALKKKICDVWIELQYAGREELELLIAQKELSNVVTKLALLRLYSISSYAVVQRIILQEKEKSGKELSEILYELVKYYRSDIIHFSDDTVMLQIREICINLLNEILIHRPSRCF